MIKNFKEISKKDTDIAGGKGASLGEMTQAGIPVPPGFVILSEAYEKFGENLDIDSILSRVEIEDYSSVQKASKYIQEMILATEVKEDMKKHIMAEFENLDTEFVAVRSSATSEDSASAAWAGQLDSYLNTTKKNLIDNVRRCWASLFTERAIFYRFHKKITNKISVAVVVQKMVESDESGIAFSVHPVTQDENHMIIEACFGLGEAIVSGSITPDSYIVDKKMKIVELTVNDKIKGLYRDGWKELTDGKRQVLDENSIIELGRLILKIEGHYGFPCDIEWAREEGIFYIVQSRPITTLTKKKKTYKLHTSVKDFSILFLDIIFNGDTYGSADYHVIWKENITYMYLSDEGMKQAYELSKNLLDDEFFKVVIDDARELNEKLRSMESNIDENNVSEQWSRYLEIMQEFCRLYMYREQPFQQALEEIVLRYHPEQEIIEIISGEKEAHPDAKEALDRLIKLGHTKLDMHENGTTLLTTELKNFTEHLAKIYDIKPEIARALNIKEFTEAIAGGNIDVEVAKDRLNGCILFKKDGEWIIETGDEFIEWKNKIMTPLIGDLKGNIAYPGKVKGKVVKHLSWTDTTELEAGDILVANMTNPQMVPYIKKAGAIVTDEGGITCHAAIFAREMKKPCIVGTEKATQVLKDGDLVEVDADNGVVRIL